MDGLGDKDDDMEGVEVGDDVVDTVLVVVGVTLPVLPVVALAYTDAVPLGLSVGAPAQWGSQRASQVFSGSDGKNVMVMYTPMFSLCVIHKCTVI